MELNDKILEIFRMLIATEGKYLKGFSFANNILEYNVKGTIIYLSRIERREGEIDNHYSKFDIKRYFCYTQHYLWDVVPDHTEKVPVFELKIGEKTYGVPTLSRIELAQSLDTLDKVIKEYESKILDNILAVKIAD